MALRVVSNYLRLPEKTFWILDTLAYHSKSMYNVGLYTVRQHSADYQENTQVRGVRPDLASRVNVLIGSYLPYTRKSAATTYSQKATRTADCYTATMPSRPPGPLKKPTRVISGYWRCIVRVSSKTVLVLPAISPEPVGSSWRSLALTLRSATGRGRSGCPLRSGSSMVTGKELTFPIPPCIKPHQIREVTILPVHGGKAY